MFCPVCQRESAYRHLVFSKWFTLYWVPLFRTGEIGRVVVCCVCQSQFREEILGLASTAPGAAKTDTPSGIDWKDWRRRASLGVLMILVIVGLGAASGDKPQPISDRMQESTNLHKEGRLVEATEKMPEVRQLDPDPAEVHTARGIEYLDRKEYVRAVAEFDEAIRLKPDFGIAYVMRGQSYEALGVKAKATEDRERAASFGIRQVRP